MQKNGGGPFEDVSSLSAGLPFRHGTLRPKEVVGPNHTVSIDINGPHPKSMGYEYILTMVDCFTRWLVLVPLRSINAAAVADACFHHWIKHHSCPTRILTDQGAQFEGQMFRRLCDRLGITKVRTSAYHPQTNAQAERVHRFLKSSLKALVGKNPKLWPKKLPYVEYAYRTTEVDGLGFSPFQLLYGRTPITPADLFTSPPFAFQQDRHKYGLTHMSDMVKMHKELEAVQLEQLRKSVRRYDGKHFDVVFEPGVKVLVYLPPRVKGPAKLFPEFRGPFTVVSALPGGVTYKVIHDETGTEMKVHVQRMIQYFVRQTAEPVEESENRIGPAEPNDRSQPEEGAAGGSEESELNAQEEERDAQEEEGLDDPFSDEGGDEVVEEENSPPQPLEEDVPNAHPAHPEQQSERHSEGSQQDSDLSLGDHMQKLVNSTHPGFA